MIPVSDSHPLNRYSLHHILGCTSLSLLRQLGNVIIFASGTSRVMRVTVTESFRFRQRAIFRVIETRKLRICRLT